MNITDKLLNTGFDLAMRRQRRLLWPSFCEASNDPAQTQARVLQKIIDTNADTDFGRRYGFADIKTAADFRRSVPVQNYETLRPYIEDQERNGTKSLTVEPPVLYAQTSGTSGSPKYLPITASGLKRISQAQRMFASVVVKQTKMADGKIVAIGSPAIEGHLPGGTPYGSASGMIYEGMPKAVRGKYVISPDILAIDDHDLRYLAIATLALAEDSVTGLATANPSTLVRLHSIMLDRFDDIATAIEHGTLVGSETLTDDQRSALQQGLPGDPKRAAHLRDLHQKHQDDLTCNHIWPGLAAITTWTGGSCGFAIGALQQVIAPTTQIVELGYSASEVRGAIGIDVTSSKAAPLLADNWFEFVEREKRDGQRVDDDSDLDSDDFLGLYQLVAGQQYYIYVTTLDGLYRYDMNDIVEVTGQFKQTPCITFVQKGSGVTNITGEKVSESQILDAVSQAQSELGATLSFFVALADEPAARYRLYIEHQQGQTLGALVADLVDQKLCELNIEYRSKRASGRLGAMVGLDVDEGTGEAYRTDRISAGQRDAQFKYLRVQHLGDCSFDFDAHVDAAVAR